MSKNNEQSDGKTPEGLKDYIDSLISGDRNKCLKYALEYMNRNPDYIQLYEEVLKTSLYHVGEMWEYNKITVATEHLATSITEFILNNIYIDAAYSGKIGKKIVLSCTEKEEHRVGLRMVADLFEKNGWDTFFLGANMPVNDLITYIRNMKPDMLALSLSVYFNLSSLENMLFRIRSVFPELPVITGGQGFRDGGKEILLKFNNVTFIDDLYSLEEFIKNNAGIL